LWYCTKKVEPEAILCVLCAPMRFSEPILCKTCDNSLA
jgi:hypothetical protein